MTRHIINLPMDGLKWNGAGPRIAGLVVMFIVAVVGLTLSDPIPQSLAYHQFADSRTWFGIQNFCDVASNAMFALVGGYGLWFVVRPQGREIFCTRDDSRPYVLFFIGLMMVSVGSAYYHLAPDNQRLFWDRLPMTVAFMALFSAFISDRIHRRFGVRWLLPILTVAGIFSVIYWDATESMGHGDLRPYYLVQFFPIVALPVICWLFPKARYTGGGYLAWLIAWYAVAKVLEIYDGQLFAILGNAVSGHTLKHVTSAIAALVVVRMLAAAGAQTKGAS